MIELIDTHAHLTFPQFDDDREAVVSRAWDAGLSNVILVGAGSGIEGNERAVEFARKDGRFFATVGIHPHDAKDVTDAWIAKLREFAADERVVAIGEIGLDYHYDHSKRDVQCDVFRRLIPMADEAQKPVVIHDRDAHGDVWRIINEVGIPEKGGVFHCFSGDAEFAKTVIDAGFYISIPGVVTFKKSAVLKDVVRRMPLERMLLESDCPYLAPEPHRGKRNEPAYVAETARKIAEIKGLSFDDVARVTTLNAKRLFCLPDAEMGSKIAYRIRNSLYLNITNRCNLACRFCPKFDDFEVKGHYLKLEMEPSEVEVIEAVGDPSGYDEVVFCGYGEPTTRLDLLLSVARKLKEKGAKSVRLNTDGLASLVYGRNVVPELVGLVDSISVSLNAPDAAYYSKNCPSKYGEKAYRAVCDFIAEAKKSIPHVQASVVALPDIDLDACRKKASELGVPLRVREYMNVG